MSDKMETRWGGSSYQDPRKKLNDLMEKTSPSGFTLKVSAYGITMQDHSYPLGADNRLNKRGLAMLDSILEAINGSRFTIPMEMHESRQSIAPQKHLSADRKQKAILDAAEAWLESRGVPQEKIFDAIEEINRPGPPSEKGR
ncbi:MAG: hypothetical protein K2Q01_07700 [Rickettsiales bacterium]|nr:hypothetical protein [Rickettsiales bacterium]